MADVVHRTTAGWPEKKYCYMSQALSCLQLAKFHGDVELVTDTVGRQLLLDEMDLPYTNVRLDLDNFPPYPGECWYLKNIFTCSIQEEPFIHVDGDVYIPCKLDRLAGGADILTGNRFNIRSMPLQMILHEIILQLNDIPDYLTVPSSELISIYNTGIFGGRDVAFISSFAADCLQLVAGNTGFANDNFGFGLDELNYEEIRLADLLNILFGGYMFTSFAARHDKTVVSLFDDVGISMLPDNTTVIASPDLSHIQSVYSKRRNAICHQLEHQLMQDHPAYYYKITSLLKEFRI